MQQILTVVQLSFSLPLGLVKISIVLLLMRIFCTRQFKIVGMFYMEIARELKVSLQTGTDSRPNSQSSTGVLYLLDVNDHIDWSLHVSTVRAELGPHAPRPLWTSNPSVHLHCSHRHLWRSHAPDPSHADDMEASDRYG